MHIKNVENKNIPHINNSGVIYIPIHILYIYRYLKSLAEVDPNQQVDIKEVAGVDTVSVILPRPKERQRSV